MIFLTISLLFFGILCCVLAAANAHLANKYWESDFRKALKYDYTAMIWCAVGIGSVAANVFQMVYFGL